MTGSGEFIRRAKTMPRDAREASGRRLKSPFPVREESVIFNFRCWIFNGNAAQSGCGIEKDAGRMPAVPSAEYPFRRFDE